MQELAPGERPPRGPDLDEVLDVFPLFVGSGRSGTTLLQVIFDSHPELAIAHEAHFIASLARRRRRYQGPAGFAVDPFLVDLSRNSNFARLGLPEGELRSLLRGPPPTRSYVAAVRRVFRLYAARRGKSKYGDKTPGYVNHIGLLARLFPEARFVHMIRDGRDVALGYMEADWGPATFAEAALHWKTRVERGRSAGRQVGSGRYREVRYEDLVADPEGTVRYLCSFVGVEFADIMLRYYERGEEFRLTTAHPDAHGRLMLPPTKGLRDWRRKMPEEGVAIFEAIAGGLLSGLGYEILTRRVSPRVGLEAAQTWARWQGKRATSSLRRLSP
jgi:hypothetical protein